MKTLLSVDKMRESDAYTIKNKISSIELMRRAGQALFDNYDWSGSVAIVCGSGNNGGDGFVLASLLHSKDILCHIFLLSEKMSEQGSFFFNKCKEESVPYSLLGEDNLSGCFDSFDIIADCMFGTGFTGDVRGFSESVIDEINRCRSESASNRDNNRHVKPIKVVSVDINSGLNGDTGMTKKCVESDLTISIGFLQPGHVLNMAKDKIGRLINCDIGIDVSPGKEASRVSGIFHLVEMSDLSDFFSTRLNFSHKGTYGYVGILGGCIQYSGAVKLANISQSALRSGCGVAKLIIPSSISQGVMSHILESTLSVIPDRDGYMIFDRDSLDRSLSGISALAIGMGWGVTDDNRKILTHILGNYSLKLVIDADGLNILSGIPDSVLKNTNCQVILTPHLMEFQRLSGLSTDEILSDPIKYAEKYASDHNVCLLLKGTSTIITDGNTTYITDRGCPGMATAGSGDVLSGVLTGLLGSHESSAFTTACASYITGLAGELAQADINPISMTSSDTASHIPAAISKILDFTQEKVKTR